ncbi:MAG: DUF2332 domain-containing protein [Tetrasphaera sp.]
MSLADQFRNHFGHRDHLYGVMLAELADDLDAGGVTATIVASKHDATRADAIQLRLLAGIYRLVLRGGEPELAAFYPTLGGTRGPAEIWPVLRPVLANHLLELQAAIEHPPQTNEVGRSALLAIGLFEAARRHDLPRIRLLEPGASAGLNLNAAHYRVTGPDWAWGPVDSPLVLDTEAAGVHPVSVEIVEHRGCDIAPIDVTQPDAAAYLRSFVWPFDLPRDRRLQAALVVAQRHPPRVDRESASRWLARQLTAAPDGVLTVVWQSITAQYWPAQESARVREIVADARSRMPLAHLTMEGVPPAQLTGGYDVLAHGPRTELDGQVIARSHHHGPPVVLATA